MKVSFAIAAVAVAQKSVGLTKPSLFFDEMVQSVNGQGQQLGGKYGASPDLVVIYNFQYAQYYGPITVGTHGETINVVKKRVGHLMQDLHRGIVGTMRRGWIGITISRDTITSLESNWDSKMLSFAKGMLGGEYGAGW